MTETEMKTTITLDPETDRTFHFRITSKHDQEDTKTKDLTIDALIDGEWERQVPSFTLPGFRQYLISLVYCQQFYLIANAKERNIPLKLVQGEVTISTGQDWIMKQFQGSFNIELYGSKDTWTKLAKEEDLDYCKQRMKLCPVSKNLPKHTEKIITVELQD